MFFNPILQVPYTSQVIAEDCSVPDLRGYSSGREGFRPFRPRRKREKKQNASR